MNLQGMAYAYISIAAVTQLLKGSAVWSESSSLPAFGGQLLQPATAPAELAVIN